MEAAAVHQKNQKPKNIRPQKQAQYTRTSSHIRTFNKDFISSDLGMGKGLISYRKTLHAEVLKDLVGGNGLPFQRVILLQLADELFKGDDVHNVHQQHEVEIVKKGPAMEGAKMLIRFAGIYRRLLCEHIDCVPFHHQPHITFFEGLLARVF